MKRQNLWLSEKDHQFFEYLHEVKVATVAQIDRDIFQYGNQRSLYSRLRTFQVNGYITSTGHMSFPRQKLISLSRKGFDEFVSGNPHRIVELRSDALFHDVTLVDIRRQFTTSQKVVEYYTENTLQTWEEYSSLAGFRPFVRVRSDGVLRAKFARAETYLAVEFEASRKHSSALREAIGKYYLSDDIVAALYITKNEELTQRLLQEERRHFTRYDARIYYKTLDSFLHDRTLRFSNRDGEIIHLGNKVTE